MATQPTIFEGDVIVKANIDTATFGDGTLTCQNLIVLGTQSDHQVDTFVVEDNIIAIGEVPVAAGTDAGILMSRHPTDITAGTPAESDTAQAGAATTITLALAANASDDFYNNYYIKITGGPGVGEIKEITDYDGASRLATVDSAWATNPTAASTYSLYNKARIGVIFDESAKELMIVGTVNKHTDEVITPSEYCPMRVGRLFQEVSQECIYYVGMHGDDSFDGFHISQAKRTFGAALTAAAAETPDVDNQIVIICLDACEYPENLVIPEWVHVQAPNARIEGAISLVQNSSVRFRSQEIAAGTAVTKTGDGFAIVQIDELTLTSGADGVLNTGVGSQLKFINHKLMIEDGVAVENAATGDGYLNTTLCDIVITGTGTALLNSAATCLNVNVQQIVEDGGASGLAIDLDAGTANIFAGKIDTTAACDLAAGTTLNLYAGEISGTETVAVGADSNKLTADEIRTHLDDITGNPHCITINMANTKELLLTTKGDIYVYNGASVIRLPVGTDGQVLTADSGEAAGVKWTNTAVADTIAYTLVVNRVRATGTGYRTIARFPWFDTCHSTYTNGKVIYRVRTTNRSLDIRLQDVTNATTLGSATIPINTVFTSTSFAVTSIPPGDAEVQLQVRKSAAGGFSPDIRGCVMQFDA